MLFVLFFLCLRWFMHYEDKQIVFLHRDRLCVVMCVVMCV